MTQRAIAEPRHQAGTTAGNHRADDQLSIVIGLEGLALGGCPINAIDLGRTLRTRGHEVEVFAIEEKAKVSLLPVAERAGFDVTVLPANANGLVRSRQMRQMMNRSSADIIHVFGPWLGPAATVAAGGLRRRAAVVTNWTMDNVHYTPAGTTLIVGTRQLQREAERWHRGPVELQEPPVDLDADLPDPEAARAFRRRWSIAPSDVAAVIVSRFDTVMKAEGIQYAIRAVEHANDVQLKLVLVGDGSAREMLEREATRVNAALHRPAVIFTGALHDPRPAYDAADITLGMGGSALRALAHAKPLIVLGINGFAKTFEPTTVEYFYENGFYGVAPAAEPVAELAAHIVSLMDSSRRDDLGRFGATEVQRRFALDVGAQHLEAIYRQSLEYSGSAPQRFARGIRTAARVGLHDIRRRTSAGLHRRHSGG